MTKREQTEADGEEAAVMGSVVYMGRGSFRMETIFEDADHGSPANDAATAGDDDGAPREVTGIVTSPYGARGEAAPQPFSIVDEDATALIERARTGNWRAPELDPLFGSQDGVPALSAPTGRALPRRRRRLVSLSRGALTAAGLLLFACGLASGAVARRAANGGAHRATASTHVRAKKQATPVAAEAVGVPPPGPALATVDVPDVPIVALPEPVVIRARKKPAAMPSTGAERAEHAAAPRWVDPFAD